MLRTPSGLCWVSGWDPASQRNLRTTRRLGEGRPGSPERRFLCFHISARLPKVGQGTESRFMKFVH